ncbi:hypothetical protein JHK86_019235 [Glycine max]|nr:hypothetical protein JHK86_019235 [Glycine max]
MASISSHPSFSSLLSFSASFSIPSLFPTSQKPCQPSKPKRGRHASKVACNGNPNPRNRRDILIGLGGLYGATTLSGNSTGSAFGAPVSPPDPTNCVPPLLPGENDVNCCPPSPIVDFEFPSHKRLRHRRPAQWVDDDYLNKYKEAVRLMRALPLDDPRNFMQQANIHCAYCHNGYRQKGFPDHNLQVHGNWLFAPFHRWYLYFHERILGSLIGDPTFALPFWNWDNPPGMAMPAIYTDENSPLYDPFRNALHQPPVIVDLANEANILDPSKQIVNNEITMFRHVVIEGISPSLFLGKPYYAGCEPNNPGAGSLEKGPHNNVHRWTGDPTQPHRIDMGYLAWAARDPIFFAHHSNVDRIWNIWKTIPGGFRRDFNDDDWLESSFLFYDENKNLVRVKIKDCLDSRKLGYDYEYVDDTPWLNVRPRPKYAVPLPLPFPLPQPLPFPLTLNSIQRTTVKRPKKEESWSEVEKAEVLVMEVEYDMTEDVKFDVFINDQGDDEIGPEDSEFAGSFMTLAHSHGHQSKRTTTSLRLAITDLLKDLHALDDESIAVTLAPRYGNKPVTIKGIKIKLVPLVEYVNV